MKQNPVKEKPIPAGLGKILLAHLIPDAKNPRKDLKKGDPEFEKINKSVEKFGQLDPIIFNTRTRKILGGHQRLKVLDSQGYTELYTYDSHGITEAGVNGLLDSHGTITQQNVGTVESNTIDSVQVLANIGVDESGTTTQGNSGIVYNTVGSTQVLGNIDDPTLHYDLNGLILNYI